MTSILLLRPTSGTSGWHIWLAEFKVTKVTLVENNESKRFETWQPDLLRFYIIGKSRSFEILKRRWSLRCWLISLRPTRGASFGHPWLVEFIVGLLAWWKATRGIVWLHGGPTFKSTSGNGGHIWLASHPQVGVSTLVLPYASEPR